MTLKHRHRLSVLLALIMFSELHRWLLNVLLLCFRLFNGHFFCPLNKWNIGILVSIKYLTQKSWFYSHLPYIYMLIYLIADSYWHIFLYVFIYIYIVSLKGISQLHITIFSGQIFWRQCILSLTLISRIEYVQCTYWNVCFWRTVITNLFWETGIYWSDLKCIK